MSYKFDPDHVKVLIEAIKNRPPLWDSQAYNYNNRVATKALWDEIATELALSDNICRAKWRNLRDVFRREWKRYTLNLQKDPKYTREPRWIFYKDLSFLLQNGEMKNTDEEENFESYYFKDHLIPSPEKSTEENYAEEGETELTFIPEERETIIIKTEDESGDESNQTSQHQEDQQFSKRRKLPDGNYVFSNNTNGNVDNPIVSEEPSEKSQKNDSNCSEKSDYYFLMSLLPYMKDLPKNRKLIVRNKMMNVLIEELDNDS